MAINIDEYNSCPTRTRHIWKRLHAQVKNLLKSIGRIWLLEIAWERKVRVSIEIMECVFDSLQALQNVWHAIEYQQVFDNCDTLSTSLDGFIDSFENTFSQIKHIGECLLSNEAIARKTKY
uniref:Dynein heavy chain tail domain-containing protein n=1 Tax=Trichuris muris TaxID=70415 RepID=A0A5S6Q6Y1_TRIMR